MCSSSPSDGKWGWALIAAEPDNRGRQLRRNVTSEGGTTAAALAVLQGDDGLQPVFDRALRAPVTEAENWIVRQHAPISDEQHR